jgi:hypothetical protein
MTNHSRCRRTPVDKGLLKHPRLLLGCEAVAKGRRSSAKGKGPAGASMRGVAVEQIAPAPGAPVDFRVRYERHGGADS